MLDRIKQEALRRGMKLMSNPKVMKLMADPRVMNAISQGFAIRGKIQDEIDDRVSAVAGVFKLVTKKELENLQRTIKRMESTMSDLQREVETHDQS